MLTAYGANGIHGALVLVAVAAVKRPEIVQLSRLQLPLAHFVQPKEWLKSLNATPSLVKREPVLMGSGANGVNGVFALLPAAVVSCGRLE